MPMSCDEFRHQLDRGLHNPDAQLFRMRIDVGDPAGDSGGRTGSGPPRSQRARRGVAPLRRALALLMTGPVR
ncbi:hypothetical protein CGZ95_14425 [Enemella evansiae]|nr:hypothetical protein CGZ95_14425 [Enemella evansiae]